MAHRSRKQRPFVRPDPIAVLGMPGREYMALAGSYRAAKVDRTRPGPVPVAACADAHLDEDQHGHLRRFCQDLYRNNEVAGMLVDRLADAVVGDHGPVLRVLSKDNEFNDAAEEYFWRWSKKPEVTGTRSLADLLRDCIADVCSDGDLWYLWTDRQLVQAVEGERLVQPGGARGNGAIRHADGSTIVRGVEFSPEGTPVRYYFAAYSNFGIIDKSTASPVPAEMVIPAISPFVRKSNQTRGFPPLARSIQRLSQFEQYQDSALLASIIGCSAAMVIKTNNPGATQSALEGAARELEDDEDQSSPDAGYPITDITPGMVAYLRENEDMGQFDPKHPTTTHDAFSLFQLRLIGGALGLPIELTLLDSSKSNYYGTRAALASTYRGLAPWRRMLAGVIQRFYTLVIGGALDRGEIAKPSDMDNWDTIDLVFPAPPMIKVSEEVGGLADGVDRCIWTRDEAIIMARGNTFSDYVERRKRELEIEREAGISPVGKPGASVAGGAGGSPDTSVDTSADPSVDPSADPSTDSGTDPGADPNADPAMEPGSLSGKAEEVKR
ncbi:MAG: phage portal protein [Planctomycetes bacterium]|nr:phage portal protein [Planctomycetota bacterium]